MTPREGVERSPESCVVLVPSSRIVDAGFEKALADTRRAGYSVWRAREAEPPSGTRERMIDDALERGFTLVLLVNPSIVFTLPDVERLRSHSLPFACGLYPIPDSRLLACDPLPATLSLRLGEGGGVVEIQSCRLGFALIDRVVFEAMHRLGASVAQSEASRYFPATSTGLDASAEADNGFCERMRSCGFKVMADTTIRLWHVGPSRFGWEDTAGPRTRHSDYTVHFQRVTPGASRGEVRTAHASFRPPAQPLPSGFPEIRMYVLTHAANRESLIATMHSVRNSDWSAEPKIIHQPPEWPVGREAGAANFKRALSTAASDECDFALILEDDVRVCRHLRHNLLSQPLLVRDQCDYLSLFIPDLIADPWKRDERHLGYRLAKPKFLAPEQMWAKNRLWGAQGYVLSRRLVLRALEQWDRLKLGQDSRVLALCAALRLPLWYTSPCLVDHAPSASAFGTPAAYAPDFDPEFRLVVEAGFQPPEAVPGNLSVSECELLWRIADGREIVELGTGAGRATVCAAQKAKRVVSVAASDHAEAIEWVQRYSMADRVEFRSELLLDEGVPCDLVIAHLRELEGSVSKTVEMASRLVRPGGPLVFLGYPDPAHPEIRGTVDDYAQRRGWRRIHQVGYTGVFATSNTR